MKRLLHVICDYQPASQEFGEILERLYTQNWDLDLHIIPTSIPSFDTVATGFMVYQFALGQNPPGTVMYVNTAPRKEQKAAMQNNAGEKLVYAKLKNGIEIVAVNSAYTLSLVKPFIEKLHIIQVENEGSQFRSRDFFPKAVSDILHEKHEERLLEEVDPTTLPDMPEGIAMWIDGFGNIKTSIRKSQRGFNEGEKVHIKINGIRRAALVTGGSFSVDEGELAYSVGSSGHDDPFMEIFLRGGSAHSLFGNPTSGAKVIVEE
ncbi:SAM-dependent chlorinase/fluorinase [Candidatus Woesebacteria bacterium]|nr:SAM-dependent chlorinase/fluorinase [Candidatus Woesebacteria bacterium]MCD8507150.1 SAM-dependent chlorinase/fluorinase [Candidatus Woesebacteria bacterium]MCD8527190.1 SAM-dependent chlorinase/fluorinase [Candidatus Woesebacteria bacterium]MCD8545956.1 SAM-dependent chlorinase/fluorinase [Candidatus Woesebacteria bacterium]